MAGPPGKTHKFKNRHFGINGKGSATNKIKLKTSGKTIKQVIPVIYIPGIFASRLEKPNGEKVWDPDDAGFMVKKLTRGMSLSKIFTFISTITKSKANWTDKEMDIKINLVTGPAQLMNIPGTPLRDTDDQKDKIKEISKKSDVFKLILDRNKIDPNKYSYRGGKGVSNFSKKIKLKKQIKKLATELHQVRRDRGWYTIMGEYIKIMEKITLKDHDEFHFPTYGFGFDWRQDIKDSGDKFKQRIDEIIAIKEYPEYGELGKDYEIEPSKKVIIVTHSMGSIVTRYTSEHSGAKGNIHGVLHLNQPTTGAPVLYRRFLVGTEIEKVPFNIFSAIESIGNNVFNEILGTTSYHFTKLVGSMPGPGPLELLPTNQHRLDNSIIDNPADIVSKNNWLDIQHNFLKPIKANNILDVYNDVYKNERIGLLACKRYDDTGKLKPYTKEEFTRVSLTSADDIDEGDKLKSELTALDKKLYFIKEYQPDTSPYLNDSYRLTNNIPIKHEDVVENNGFKKELYQSIDKAKSFHDTLKLNKHPNTTVAGSFGKSTVLKIDITLNKNNVLELPFSFTSDGDGTVPRTSQVALLATKAELVKDGLIKGDIAHADIPKNGTALKQVEQFLTDVTLKLSKENVAQ